MEVAQRGMSLFSMVNWNGEGRCSQWRYTSGLLTPALPSTGANFVSHKCPTTYLGVLRLGRRVSVWCLQGPKYMFRVEIDMAGPLGMSTGESERQA